MAHPFLDGTAPPPPGLSQSDVPGLPLFARGKVRDMYDLGDRLLMVATTNLDANRGVIWNVGAIAASGDPKALDLIHDILIASAAIPAAFPPVMIDVEIDGKPYQEMHVDGGAKAQVFLYPPSLELKAAAEAQGVHLDIGLRMSVFREEALLPFYVLSALSGLLGMLALGLACVGLYGVMTFAVNQRTRELGIRLALGATAEKVVGLFVGDGMRLVGIGLVFGLAGGGLLSLALGKILFGPINFFDAAAFAVVTVLFAFIALSACWLPARRASAVDPLVAMRTD